MPQATNFRIFNPDTMAKPTAGYSQVAVVTGGSPVYMGKRRLPLGAGKYRSGRNDTSLKAEEILRDAVKEGQWP